MLEALEPFHSAGFVHRNIKPHNYTIERPDRVDVISMLDFSLNIVVVSLIIIYFNTQKMIKESWIIIVMELHDSDAVLWCRETEMDEIKAMKGELCTSKELDYIFDIIVPSEYRKIVALIRNLRPVEKHKNPDGDKAKKINLVPIA
uniref:Protein kinase domain-containing protein n=1 Tax=Strongyloides venezuelensis TaxID=75913 RepID=A0A0K0F889_STRVS